MSSVRRRTGVIVTRDFETNLKRIEAFLEGIGELRRFDDLVDDLLQKVIPLLRVTPSIGAPFSSARLPVDVAFLLERIRSRLHATEVRTLVRGDFVVLYLVAKNTTYLAAVRHHREAAFRIGLPRRSR